MAILDKAGEEYLTLVHLPYRAWGGLVCARWCHRKSRGRDPGATAVRAKLLFECASWRNAGSQPLQLGLAG